MDIQQILAAPQGQASTAKPAGGADAAPPAGGFAKAMAALSPGRPAAADEATDQAPSPGARRKAVRDAMEALDRGTTDGASGPLPGGLEGLEALASAGPLPEALLAQLSRPMPAGTDDASGVAPGSGGVTVTPELVAVMERLALIQGAGLANHAPAAGPGVPGGLTALAAAHAGTLPTPTPRSGTVPTVPAVAPPGAGAANPVLDARQVADGQRPTSPPLTTGLENPGKAGTAPSPLTPAATPTPQALAEALSTGRENGARDPLLGATPPPGGMTPAPGPAATGPAATTPLQATLGTPVNSPAWPQQLGQQLIRFGQGGGEQRIEMQLHPAELGPLSVTLKVGDQGAQAQFLSAHAQVRQALEQAIPQLREALAEQGIALGETSVGEQRQGSGEEPAADFAGHGSPGGGEAEDGGVAIGGASDTQPRGVALDGRVDLYA